MRQLGWVLVATMLLTGCFGGRPGGTGDEGANGDPPPGTTAAGAPVIFFTDLSNAPVRGWAGRPDRGAAVSVWGLRLGSARGHAYVSVGGVPLSRDEDYAEWGATERPRTARGLERVTFWLNPDLPLGATTITVTTPAGTSNALPFFTRGEGRIFFLRPDGNDAASGRTPAAAWKTFAKVRELQAGDVLYVMGGRYGPENAAAPDRFVQAFNLDRPGAPHRSIAVVGYPGEEAVLGRCEPGLLYFVRGSSEGSGHVDLSRWVLGKLKVQVRDAVFYLGNNGRGRADALRLVGFDATTCEARAGHGTAFQPEANAGLRDLRFLGNYVHHTGKPLDWQEGDGSGYRSGPLYLGGWGTYEGVTEVAYNEFAYNNGRVQFFGHKQGDALEHLSFHHNWIHHTATPPWSSGAGSVSVVFGDGDPSGSDYVFLREADIYNNLWTDNSGGVRFGGTTGGGNGGELRFFNNTHWHSGFAPTFRDFQFGNAGVVLSNNVVRPRDGDTSGHYGGWTSGAHGPVRGDHNLYWGLNKGVPDWDDPASSREQPPRLVDPEGFDFRPGADSPARDAGRCLPLASPDYLGVPRPQGNGCDLGAFEAAP